MLHASQMNYKGDDEDELRACELVSLFGSHTVPGQHSQPTPTALGQGSSGNVRPQSSYLGEPSWTVPCPKVWNWCARADLNFKTKQKVQTGNYWTNLPHNSRMKDILPPEGSNQSRIKLLN